MSKKNTITITVKGPAGCGKLAILAKIKETIFGDAEDFNIETLFQIGEESPSPRFNQTLWKERCDLVSKNLQESSSKFLFKKGISTVVFREKQSPRD